MPSVEVNARTGSPDQTLADTRVVGLFEAEKLSDPELQALVDSGEAKADLKKACVTHETYPDGSPGRRVIIAGLGKRGGFDRENARLAATTASQKASELGTRSLSWAAPIDEVAGAIVEGTLLEVYSFDRFKTAANSESERLQALEVVSAADTSDAVEQARICTEAQNACRDLQNLPSNVATPAYLAERAAELAASHGSLTVETLGREEIVAKGMGAFAAVARGTDTEPRLIVMRYEGGSAGAHLGFVGKAVTFDTGGISIKPSSKMQEMKFDMSGGAAVIEALGAIAALDLPVRVTAVVPSTENMPSGHSVKPGDIVTAMNKKTIEVNNTDAEGRLLLADALCYAVEQGAEKIVDLATLTGAIIVALGSTYAGLFSNDDDWCSAVESAGAATGELGWRLPLHPEYFELTKGTYADLTNASEQRKAMSIYAAEFLRQFVGERPWVHIDIAGTAWDTGRPYFGNGATGFGVRSLVELAKRAATA